MTNAEIEYRIQHELNRIEREENVQIFYACESGSRAWGFASTDSDYDVRFFYVRPTAWYLCTGKRRDVIERPITDDLDITGWDLPKTLALFRKSNPPLLEKLQSPWVYRNKGSGFTVLRDLMPRFYSPRSCSHHYLHMARGNYREYLQGEQVWLKKYLYVLRPVLACLWIEQGLGPVPMVFQVMVDRLVEDSGLRGAIANLLARKMRGEELAQGPRDPLISSFLDEQLERLKPEVNPPAETWKTQEVDDLFRKLLVEYNGPEI